MSDSDTPRTDKKEYTDHMGKPQGVVDADFARTLERENAELKERIAAYERVVEAAREVERIGYSLPAGGEYGEWSRAAVELKDAIAALDKEKEK